MDDKYLTENNMRKLFTAFIAFIILATASVSVMAGPGDELKTDFIFGLFDDIKWPANNTDSNTIYVVGESPLVDLLEQKADKRNAESLTITIKKISIDDDFAGCKILLIAGDDLGTLAKVLKKVKGTSILTVSDIEGFARYGVMINILNKTKKGKQEINLIINKMTARKAGFEIPAKLINKAEKIFG